MKYKIETIFKSLNYRPSNEEFQKALTFFSDERLEVRNMFEKLSWDESEEVQHKAIDYLAETLLPWEYIYLILPDRYEITTENGEKECYLNRTGKSRWENAAKTIIKIGWPKVDHILVPLFMWLVDPNWPGSELIYNFMLSLPENVLRKKMEEILDNPQHYETRDYEDLVAQIEDLRNDLEKLHHSKTRIFGLA